MLDKHCLQRLNEHENDLRAVEVWMSVEKMREIPAMTCSHRRVPFMMATLQQQPHQHLCFQQHLCYKGKGKDAVGM